MSISMFLSNKCEINNKKIMIKTRGNIGCTGIKEMSKSLKKTISNGGILLIRETTYCLQIWVFSNS